MLIDSCEILVWLAFKLNITQGTHDAQTKPE